MRKRHILLSLGLLTVFFTAGMLLFPQLRNGGEMSSGNALARTPSKTLIPVVVAVVTSEPFTETLEALGTAKANESVVITPTLEERVVDIFFEDGDAVRKDQVLVKLDDSESRYLLAEVSATLREQQKHLKESASWQRRNPPHDPGWMKSRVCWRSLRLKWRI